jgi:hypothetical protein
MISVTPSTYTDKPVYPRQYDADNFVVTGDGRLHIIAGSADIAVYDAGCWSHVERSKETKVSDIAGKKIGNLGNDPTVAEYVNAKLDELAKSIGRP